MKKILISLIILLLVFVSPMCGAITLSFATNYDGPSTILVPSVTGNITYYKWNISENNGLYNGSTGWVNSTTVQQYIYTFTGTDSITVTLYAKNETKNASYTSIVESLYEPDVLYESYDNTKDVIIQGTKNIDVGPTNPWFPWSFIGNTEQSNTLLVVVIAMIFVLVFFVMYRGKGSKRIKVKDYIIDYIEDKG